MEILVAPEMTGDGLQRWHEIVLHTSVRTRLPFYLFESHQGISLRVGTVSLPPVQYILCSLFNRGHGCRFLFIAGVS